MMQKRIFIYLHTTPTLQASWIILDAFNKITASVERGELEKLTVDKDCDVIVVVPTEDVLLTQVQLPKMSRSRLMQALPFALEEQLIADVSELHFAVGDYQEDGTFPVAVIAQTKMTAWIHLFSELGISPRAFIPDIFTLDYEAFTWNINSSHHCSVVRTARFGGFACEQENLNTLVQLKLAEESHSDSIALANTQYSETQLLENLSQKFATLAFINLLQSQFHAKPQASNTRKVWLTTCYLAIALVVLVFMRDSISYFILHQHAKKLDAAIAQIYHANFPQATSVVAPRDRMEQKLHALSGEISKNNFLALLSMIGKSISEAHVNIANMDFREQRVVLEISAASFDNLDAFTQALKKQGLAVKQQSAAEAGAGVKASLLIQAGGA